MFDVFDWRNVYKDEFHLSNDLGLKYQGPGWYVAKGDYLLVTKTENGFWAYCWNGCDPRESWKSVSELPVFQAG